MTLQTEAGKTKTNICGEFHSSTKDHWLRTIMFSEKHPVRMTHVERVWKMFQNQLLVIKIIQVRTLMKLMYVGSCSLIITKEILMLERNLTNITKLGNPQVILRTILSNRKVKLWDHFLKIMNVEKPSLIRQPSWHLWAFKQKRNRVAIRNRGEIPVMSQLSKSFRKLMQGRITVRSMRAWSQPS